MTIYRDVGLSIGSFLLVIGFAAMEEISLYSAIILLAWYLLLVLIVVIQDSMEASAKKAA